MAWVLDNIQVIVFVAGVIAYWLNQRRREKAGQEADYDGDGVPENRPVHRKIDPNQPDPEEAERARRIQEEIRRKIAERRGQGVPPSVPAEPLHRRLTVDEPPPIPARTPRPNWPRPTDAPTPAAPGPLPEVLRRILDPRGEIEAQARAQAQAADVAARERLHAIEAELRKAQEQQRLEAERAAAFREASAESQTARANVSSRAMSRAVLDDLRQPGNLRRAIVLREVLGPPVALR